MYYYRTSFQLYRCYKLSRSLDYTIWYQYWTCLTDIFLPSRTLPDLFSLELSMSNKKVSIMIWLEFCIDCLETILLCPFTGQNYLKSTCKSITTHTNPPPPPSGYIAGGCLIKEIGMRKLPKSELNQEISIRLFK